MTAFHDPPRRPTDKPAYLATVDTGNDSDAYHSLSIEGYRVTSALIDRVRVGGWRPDLDSSDRVNRDALAARGHWLAFHIDALSQVRERPCGAGSSIHHLIRLLFRIPLGCPDFSSPIR